MGKGQELYEEAKKFIPGGTQLLSKRPEMFLPDYWPAYYSKAKGCEVWDLDGNKYIDASYMGIGACVIGYADPDVDRAVKKAIDNGGMSTLNAPEEVSLAKELCRLHPWAKMARYARSGGEAMTIAVRIARAFTGKDKIIFCGYHGWHDWYLSSNLASDKSLDGHLMPGLEPTGVPRQLQGTAFPFEYNDTEAFKKLIEAHKGEIAAVVLEPIRNFYPKKGFLETIRKVTKEQKITFVIDEISAGFRMNAGGAHKILKVEPDIAVFSKALGNGYPISAIIGRREVMSAAQDTFISSTSWTERIGPVAALATIKKYEDKDVAAHLEKIGKMVQDGWSRLSKKHGFKIKLSGMYAISHFEFDYKEPLVLKTLFTQLMLEKGFLASNAFYGSYGHKIRHVRAYLKAVNEVFEEIGESLKSDDPKKKLLGEVCHSGFRRLT